MAKGGGGGGIAEGQRKSEARKMPRENCISLHTHTDTNALGSHKHWHVNPGQAHAHFLIYVDAKYYSNNRMCKYCFKFFIYTNHYAGDKACVCVRLLVDAVVCVQGVVAHLLPVKFDD